MLAYCFTYKLSLLGIFCTFYWEYKLVKLLLLFGYYIYADTIRCVYAPDAPL